MKLKRTLQVAVLFAFSCSYGKLWAQSGESQQATITLYPNEEYQRIYGFGVAQADWADELFLFPGRKHAIEAMFGESGLQLNILRGEIFPHYSKSPVHNDFGINGHKALGKGSCKGLKASEAKRLLNKHELLELCQYWLTDYVQKKYPDTRCIFSTWSPPAWMKEGGHVSPDGYVSGGSLSPAHYQDYADYLADFCQAYAAAGIPIYGLSPSNEPGYAAPWNSCVWSAAQMGTFISGYLLPTLERNAIPTKVIFGENPAWSTVFDRLKMISSTDFVNEVLASHPEMDGNRLIAAGHGYVLPDTIPLPAELRRTPIVPFAEAEKRNVPAWVTEISDITPLDLSMDDGLRWASTFSDYLTRANVSAIVWWAGAQPTTTNESLIVLDSHTGHFTLSKRYDTFGNYTRYIPQGSIRIGQQAEGLPQEVRIASFKHGKGYTVVVVNPTDREITCRLDFADNPSKVKWTSHTTTAKLRWNKRHLPCTQEGRQTISLPPLSVTTCTGQ